MRELSSVLTTPAACHSRANRCELGSPHTTPSRLLSLSLSQSTGDRSSLAQTLGATLGALRTSPSYGRFKAIHALSLDTRLAPRLQLTQLTYFRNLLPCPPLTPTDSTRISSSSSPASSPPQLPSSQQPLSLLPPPQPSPPPPSQPTTPNSPKSSKPKQPARSPVWSSLPLRTLPPRQLASACPFASIPSSASQRYNPHPPARRLLSAKRRRYPSLM